MDNKKEELLRFKEALQHFVEELCSALPKTGVATRRWTHVIHEDQGWSFQEEERPDYAGTAGLLMRKFYDNFPDSLAEVLDSAKSISDIADRLLVDGNGKPIREYRHQQWWVMNVAGKFLNNYLEKTRTFEFDEPIFEEVYNRLIEDIESSTMIVKELSPLMNISLDCESISISPDLILRKLTTNELELLLNESVGFPYSHMLNLSGTDITEIDCAIEATYKQKRHEAWGSNKEVRNNADDLVTTLRLLTDNNIYMALTVISSDSMLQPSGGISSSLRPRLFGRTTNLGSSYEEDIVKMWNGIRSLPNTSSVRLALKRWNSIFERFDGDDALIDYWIALEALFLPNSSQELRYRSSFRIGAFIGEEPDEKEEIFRSLMESYNLRSKIVHGGVSSSKGKAELINVTRGYLRRALIKILTSNSPFEPENLEVQALRK